MVNFSNFFENILIFLGVNDHVTDMKYILNNQGIKNHINNNLSYDINKEQLIKNVKYRNPNYPHPGLDYLINLSEKDLIFNVDSATKRKLKM